MKVYFKGLFPCEGRKLNMQQNEEVIKKYGHEVVDSLDQADKIGRTIRTLMPHF